MVRAPAWKSKGSRFNSQCGHFNLLLFPHIAPSGLVSTREAAHPAVILMGTWGSKCPTVLVLLSGDGVVVEL